MRSHSSLRANAVVTDVAAVAVGGGEPSGAGQPLEPASNCYHFVKITNRPATYRKSLIHKGCRGVVGVGALRQVRGQGHPPFRSSLAERGAPNYWPLEKWEGVRVSLSGGVRA